MNTVVLLLALSAVPGEESNATLTVVESPAQEAQNSGSHYQETCRPGLLHSLFGHRLYRRVTLVRGESQPAAHHDVQTAAHLEVQKAVRYEVQGAAVSAAVASDPGNWYVHRQLLGGASAPNYSYTINHSSTGVTGQNKLCPASGPGFTTIEQAVEAVLCMQSPDNTCSGCTNPPTPSTPGFNWFTHRDGTDFTNYTYRIEHVYSSSGSSLHCPANSTGYARTAITKATDAVIGFQHGTCPPCP